MKVSVIIPAYNSSEAIGRCITSLKAQTLDECEFIIVDDCSSDNTVELASSLTQGDNRFIILVQQTRTDPFQARVRGINAASGEYIMFLDADDEFSTTACEIAYNTIKEQETDIFCFGSLVIPAENTAPAEIAHTQHYLNSYEGFSGKISGKQAVLDCYFKTNKFGISTSLWKKIFRRQPLLEAVNKATPAAPLRYGQDLLQLIMTMLHIESIYVDNSLKLHRYFLGAGATSQAVGALSIKNFQRMLTTRNSLDCLISYLHEQQINPAIAKRAIKHSTHSYLNTCSGNFWYLNNDDMLEGFHQLYNTWGEAIYSTPFFYSPTNLIRFKRCIIQKLDKCNPLRTKLNKKFYTLFLSIPIYKSKLYFKILFKR